MKDATKIDRNKRGVRDMAARTRGILAERFPACFAGKNGMLMFRLGKSCAGRLLDGREHNDFPEARS